MKKHKSRQEVVLYGTENDIIHIPEIKIRYNKGKNHPKITSDKLAYEFLLKVYGRDISIQEQFIVLFLDRARNCLGYYKHSLGTLSSTVVDIPMILGIALKSQSRALILSHNHPSGMTKPSQADIEMTKKIEGLAKLHDIKILDHLIVTKDNGHCSCIHNNPFNNIQLNGDMGAEQQLRAEIYNQLKRVKASNAPNVFEKILSQSGYREIEQRIIYLVIHDRITPSAAVPQIENELG
jgi:DNA repair protein RadC